MVMSKLASRQDAYGHAYWDHYRGRGGYVGVERDDGYTGVSYGAEVYFREYKDWLPFEKRAMRFVRGRVLDVGCGAGRAALHLQSKGHDILAVDHSPLAIKICKLRGVKSARVMSITDLSTKLGAFDTILMLGNNFSLMGTHKEAHRLLKRWHGITSASGRIIAQTGDPYQTTDPTHLAYHRRNRKLGRAGGEMRLRIWYLKYGTPWLPFLHVSRKELRAILQGTGWELARTLESGDWKYFAILEKTERTK